MSDSRDNGKTVAVLVISFDISITRPQLDAMMKYGRDDQEWEQLSVPPYARARLFRAIKEAIAAMQDEHGRIMQDDTIWREAVDGGEQ